MVWMMMMMMMMMMTAQMLNNTGLKNLTFFVPQTSIGEFSSTFYAEFRNVYRIFLSGWVSKLQRNMEMCKLVLYVLMKQAETFL
jgi:hypothetical protein